MKNAVLLAGVLLLSVMSHGQLIKRISERAKRKVEQKIDQKVDKGIDDAMDGKKKDSKDKSDGKKDSGKSDSKNATDDKAGTPTLTTYSKFDFIPGEKILCEEDFSQDAIGDFPAKWNTNSGAELVSVEGQEGKWLSISQPGVFLPEFITSLPENFTLQFDLICNTEFNYYSTPFTATIAQLNSQKDFANWRRYGSGKGSGVEMGFHPVNAGNNEGRTEFAVFVDNKKTMSNNVSSSQFHAKNNNQVRISIWRQQQRLRVYMNEEKIWDLPRAFVNDVNYNTVLFMVGEFSKKEDRYLVANIRLAVGQPDTRSKLITEGKFVTSGILFDVNSDRIKPESYGVLKDIASVLKENASVKVKIIGHTDTDGDDKSNLELSRKRALAVKAMLQSEFGIDAGRMETDGKGESEPADSNSTAQGKANNRRVEFIRL